MRVTSLAKLLLTAAILWLPQATAEVKSAGPYQVHFSAFESTFLSPQIANQYQITRSRFQAVINVSVLDPRKNNAAAQVELSGQAKNLLGHNIELKFKEVKEEQAIYYLEQLKYSNEETFRFFLEIETPEGRYPVQFMKKFYVNE